MSERKIVDYKIFKFYKGKVFTVDSFMIHIKRAINENWQPHGSPVLLDEINYCHEGEDIEVFVFAQAMVKYEETEK